MVMDLWLVKMMDLKMGKVMGFVLLGLGLVTLLDCLLDHSLADLKQQHVQKTRSSKNQN